MVRAWDEATFIGSAIVAAVILSGFFTGGTRRRCVASEFLPGATDRGRRPGIRPWRVM